MTTMNNNSATINYASMKVAELRALCKEQGLANYSHAKKAELIAMLEKAAEVPAEAVVDTEPVIVAEETSEDVSGLLEAIDANAGQIITAEAVEVTDMTEEIPVAKVQAVAASTKTSSFKGVSMKEMTIAQLRLKMEADIREFRFIEDEGTRRKKIGAEIVSHASKTDGFIDRNVIESIVAKYHFGITGYLILKKNGIIEEGLSDKVNRILAGLLRHWVMDTKVLSVAALQLRERVEGAGCKGTGYRHKDCTHDLCKAWKVWQEVPVSEWNAVMASNQYKYMVFKLNINNEDKAPENAPVSESKEERISKFKTVRKAIWAKACKTLNGFISRSTGYARTTAQEDSYKVDGLLIIDGEWVVRCTDGLTHDYYTYDGRKFAKCFGEDIERYRDAFSEYREYNK